MGVIMTLLQIAKVLHNRTTPNQVSALVRENVRIDHAKYTHVHVQQLLSTTAMVSYLLYGQLLLWVVQYEVM